MTMTTRRKAVLGGALAGVSLAVFTAGVSFAQGAPSMQTPSPAPGQTAGAAPTHEQMDQMMGAGASERMHEAMGDDAEQLMDQCVSMQGMMGGAGGMSGMMGGQGAAPSMPGTPGR